MSTELPTRLIGALVELRTEKAAGTKRSDFRYVGLEHMETDSPFLVGTAPAAASTSTNNVFDEDDILFGKLRPYLRKSVRAPFAGYCSTDILVLRANPDVDARFAAKVFQSDVVFDHATATSIGTRMPRTSWSSLSELEVFCPHAIGEQRRIAEILDTLDEAIRATEALIAKLEQVKKGLLHDLLTRGIDDNGELRDPERHPEQFKDSPLGRIPREWDAVTLDPLLVGTPKNGVYKPASEIGAGSVMVGQLSFAHDDRVDFAATRRARMTLTELEQYGLRHGDILVTRVFATLEGVGRSILVANPPEPAVYESNMMRIRVSSQIEPEFLFHWMKQPRARAHIASVANISNQTSINQTGLKSLPVALPAVAEQLRILERIRNLEQRRDSERELLAKLRVTKLGLMDDLLSGRVRVSADSQEVSA